jgi:hypothetical protein
LTRSGHSVSERTAQRWKKGETQPKPQDVRAILALLGTTKEAAPPEWAERLLAAMDSVLANQSEIIAEQRRTAESVAPLDRLLNVEGLRDLLEAMPPPSDVDPHDLPDMGVQGTGAPGGRASS